jgi:thioredoxin-like negative regulator of GroEL
VTFHVAGTGRGLLPAAIVLALVARPATAFPQAAEDTLRLVERSLTEEDFAAARSHLERAAAEHPQDCAVRAWLAWFEIESGRESPAQALLGADGRWYEGVSVTPP